MSSIQNLSTEYCQFLRENQMWDETISPGLNRLRKIIVKYYNFEYQEEQGELIAYDLVSEEIIRIFDYLWKVKFPLNKINLMSEYSGNDILSMEDNNSSCFNSRKIIGSDNISLHAYGMALDINPLQNPYIKNDQIEPSQGINYLDREKEFPGKAENILDFMQKTLFNVWGGRWRDIKDYHHFQLEKGFAIKLLESSYEEGKILINNYHLNISKK